MVARTQPDSKFIVAFWRDGECIDSRTAPDGREALKTALMLIAALAELQDGDKLTVSEG
jgi:hypothetical protein